mmetsp:Transcript_4224/g.12084  ORF Transcript_4224/g.12084 Transcript_4224/m.12084 type:complete len:215 (+) Transcript_4224:107-751(+)
MLVYKELHCFLFVCLDQLFIQMWPVVDCLLIYSFFIFHSFFPDIHVFPSFSFIPSRQCVHPTFLRPWMQAIISSSTSNLGRDRFQLQFETADGAIRLRPTIGIGFGCAVRDALQRHSVPRSWMRVPSMNTHQLIFEGISEIKFHRILLLAMAVAVVGWAGDVRNRLRLIGIKVSRSGHAAVFHGQSDLRHHVIVFPVMALALGVCGMRLLVLEI